MKHKTFELVKFINLDEESEGLIENDIVIYYLRRIK